MHTAMPQTRILLLFSGLLIIVVLSLSFIPIKYFFAYAAYTRALPLAGGPSVNDSSLKVRTVFTGLRGPTSMAFLGPNDILVLEKNKGTVQRIVNGNMLPTPVLQVPVATSVERGMLGIAVAKKNGNSEHPFIFLFYTESGGGKTGDDITSGIQPLGNRVYRYEFQGNKLVNPKLILSLPAIPSNATSPETNHNGGKVVIGPDNDVYAIIGDVGGHAGQAQNVASGAPLDGTSGIFRVTQDGEPVKDNPFARGGDREMHHQQQQETEIESGGLGAILGGESTAQGNNNNNNNNNNKTNAPLLMKNYYAYGIRNSFGMDFDPVTKKLWDTENGPMYGDEINLIVPGLDSGWQRAMGMWQVHGRSPGPIVSSINPPSNLVLGFGNGGRKGEYRSPEFAWLHTIAPTALKFLSSDKLGKQYENTMFVGDVNTGNLYNFKLNPQRTGFLLNGPLADKVSNTPEELQQVIFGKGFGVITDIQVGPEDGYLYVLTYQGTIYKIAPSSSAN
jgi:glucose/arabinose dehydrogenase